MLVHYSPEKHIVGTIIVSSVLDSRMSCKEERLRGLARIFDLR